jgi:hypothetical protein
LLSTNVSYNPRSRNIAGIDVPYILIIALQVALVVHVFKTGRNTYWVWAIAMLPLVGSLAYFIVEILPGLMGSRTTRRAVSSVKKTIDPGRDLRQAERQLRLTDSIDARRKFADQLLEANRYDEAIEHYRSALVGLYKHDPQLLLGLAKAQFAKGEASEARKTLDELIAENPGFKSPEGHLLYARALEKEGNRERALKEYETLAKYFPGAEAKYRYAVLLKQLDKTAEARAIVEQMLNDAELATGFFRKNEKEWLDKARREL